MKQALQAIVLLLMKPGFISGQDDRGGNKACFFLPHRYGEAIKKIYIFFFSTLL
jgi:hypothetical protein